VTPARWLLGVDVMLVMVGYRHFVPLPVSKNQLNKLGERLAASDPPRSEDMILLNEVIRSYQDVLLSVERELSTLGLAATSRVKTKDVLIDKLRREEGMALARVQDLAGARIVTDGNLRVQDDIVRRLKEHFDSWTAKESRVVDRRQHPSQGYRAVHVIVFPESVPVEIQVRTELQNYWAQVVESLADRWGRGIRYGEPPEDPDQPTIGYAGRHISRREFIGDFLQFSNTIYTVEVAEVFFAEFDSYPYPTLEERIEQDLPQATGDIAIDAPRYYPILRKKFKRLVSRTHHDRRVAGRIIRRNVPINLSPDAEWVISQIERCDISVSLQAKLMDAKAKSNHADLCDRLQNLGSMVEQGGFR
jgi:ppGpp synthetase/RelA/SpoT-type nucleotidyltranferase